MFYQLLYVSGARGPVSADDIASILESSRRNNARVGVTGLLIYTGGVFIQFLEGHREDVQKLAAHIRKDPRHRNFMVMMERESEERVFATWHMGFKAFDRSIAEEDRAFSLSRAALEQRATGPDAALILDTIVAFAGDHALKVA